MTSPNTLSRLKEILFSLLLMTATRLLPAQKIEEESYMKHFSIDNIIFEEEEYCGFNGCWSCYFAFYWNHPKYSAPDQVLEIIKRTQPNRSRTRYIFPPFEFYGILPKREQYQKYRNSRLGPY